MVVLDVEVADFAAAASQVRHEVAENLQLCLEGLRLPGGLVGVDPAGVSWAAGYDPAARAAVTATARLADAAYKTAAMLAASGRNYDHAEAASVTGGATPELDWGPLLVEPPAVPVPHVPSAGGAGAKTPAGWWLIAHTIGYVWPGGHQDKLRQTAAAWRSAAGGLDLATPVPLGILGRFAADRIPEYDGIAAVLQQLYHRLEQLADTYRALAESCEQYADHLDDCHREVEHELTELAVESAALQTGGAILAAFTFGVAEVPTQAAQAARIAATAGRVGVLIEHLTTAARRLAHTVRTVQAIAHDITDSLRALAQTRIALAVVEQVPKLERLTKIGRDAEKGAGVGSKAEKAAQDVVKPAESHPGAGFEMRPHDREHILDGNNGGGGHRWPGADGKTPFPEHWSDDQITRNVEDIVRSPSTTWRAQGGSGGQYMKSGQPAVWRAWETRDGVRIRVAWEPATGRIPTSFPDSGPAKGVLIP